MVELFKKYWTVSVFLLFVGFILLVIFDNSNIDNKLSSEIHRYKDARKEIINALPELRKLDTVNYKGKGVPVRFVITKELAQENELDTLVALYEDGLIEDLIITPSNEILFHLKTCDNLECSKNQSGVHGFYSHYLSKNRANFIDENSLEVVDRENVEEWAYSIVWTSKD